MRIVIVHNFYRSSRPSGENGVVREEAAQLRKAGHDVRLWTVSSDALLAGGRRARVQAMVVNSPGPVIHRNGSDRFRAFLEAVSPDVVHCHNLYPLISPAAIITSKSLGVPVVQTIHNYRRECVKGTFFRDGAECTLCDGRKVAYPAIVHSCYGSSRLNTIPMVASKVVHSKTWRKIDINIVLTEFQRRWLELRGVDPKKIVVRPTSCRPSERTDVEPAQQACFVGRLDFEKGVDVLLNAWQSAGVGERGWKLAVAGEGPLDEYVRKVAASDQSVEYVGKLEGTQVRDLIGRSKFTLLPSRWMEGFPKVVAESFAEARPVAALSNPNIDSVIGDCGWVARDGSELADLIRHLAQAPGDVSSRGERAAKRYALELSPTRTLRQLESIYESVL